jgi:hypothetical protein
MPQYNAKIYETLQILSGQASQSCKGEQFIFYYAGNQFGEFVVNYSSAI